MNFLSKAQNLNFSTKIFKKCRPTILHSYKSPIIIYYLLEYIFNNQMVTCFFVFLSMLYDCRTL